MSISNNPPELPQALSALAIYPQFILWRPEENPGKKDNKVPLTKGLLHGNPHDPVNWMNAADAYTRQSVLGAPYGIGFVLTAADPFFVVDIDDAATGDGWSPLANKLHEVLSGAGVETSYSGNGLHWWATYHGPEPYHRCKDSNLKLELYTQNRFIALGRPDAIGNAAKDCTDGLHKVIDQYFAPNEANGAGGDWRPAWEDLKAAGVDSQWNGPLDDVELIAKALKSRSANQVFGSTAKFIELWNADAEKLAEHWSGNHDGYDASVADAALAQHLAFYTGKDAARIERLMRQSKLERDKWNREDYLHRTIVKACNDCDQVYNQDYKKPDNGAETATQTGTPQVIQDRGELRTPGEIDVAKAIRDGHAGAHCFSVDSGRWYSREPDKLWKLDKRAIRLHRLTSGYMETYGLKRGNSITGIEKFLKAYLPDRELWDNDPYLLGLPNDTVLDVRNGKVRAAKIDDRITRRLTKKPEAGEPVAWLKVLRETHAGKPDTDAIIHYLQMFAGYALTGRINTHKFLFLVGPPGGGKGTFVNTLARIWGTQPGEGYATSIPSDALLDGRVQHSQWLTLFDGPRLAFVGESNNDSSNSKGTAWRVGDLKTLTAFDPMSANKMRQDSYTFQPTAKLIIAANKVPDMRRFDDALRRRLVLIRCDNPVPNNRQDIDLAETLWAESGKILNWALQGATEYCRNGLPPMPESVTAARDDYLRDQDTFGEFLSARFINAPGQFIAAETVRNHHRLWLHQNPENFAWSDRMIKQEMANRGYCASRKRINEKIMRGFLGLKEQ